MRPDGARADRAAIAIEGAVQSPERWARGLGGDVLARDPSLVLGFADPDTAADAAIELRLRAPRSAGGTPRVRIGLVASGEREPRAVVEHARSLARVGAEGEVVIEERLRSALSGDRGLRFSSTLPAAAPAVAAWRREWPAVTGTSQQPPLPEGAISASRTWGVFGRAAELGRIEAAWRLAREGRRGLVLVTGEAGIGKTRLATEAAREAYAAGATVLFGHHDADVEIPHQGFAEALEQLAAHAPEDLLAEIRDEVAVLADLAPGLLRRFGELPPSPRRDPGARHLLLLAVATVLSSASERRPLLILLDDLHAADVSSLLVLRHLLLGPTTLRGLVVGTHRPAELAPEAATILGELCARLSAPEIELSGLGEAEMIGLACQVTPANPRPVALGRTLSRDTGGNALYATEVLRGISESAGAADGEGFESVPLPIPRSLHEAMAARVRRLGDPAAQTLLRAAVAGREFDAAAVARSLDEPLELVERQLAAAERAALIEPGRRPGRYRFTHAVIQRSLYQVKTAAERGRAHRQLAEALEQLAGERDPDAAGDLARHWLEASPPAPAHALRWASWAGDAALARFQPEAATRLFRRALELGEAISPEDRCDLLVGLGTAQRHAGDSAFRETLLEAGRLATRLDDPSRLVRAALENNRGFTSSAGRVDPERVSLLERAIEALEPGGSSERAHLLAELAQELTFSPDPEHRMALSDEALRTAREAGDANALAYALIARFMPTWAPQTLPQRLDDTAESLRAASAAADPLLEFHALHWRTVGLVQSGAIAEASDVLGREEALARRLGDATARWIAAMDRGNLALIAGHLDDAERLAARSLELGTTTGQPDALAFYASQIACIRWEQGRLIELRPLIQEAVEQNPGIPAFRSLLALAQVQSGLNAEAEQLLRAEASDGFGRLPLDPAWLAGVTTYAHVAAALGNGEAASILYELIEPFSDQIVYTAISVWGDVAWALGRLAVTCGDQDAAESHLSMSSARAERIGAPVWRARADVSLAAMLIERGEDRRARAMLASAAAVAARAGAGGIEREARLAADRAKLPRRSPELDREQLLSRGLTPRQVDVIGLVAAGRTNAEIGRALGISDATVKRHLERTYKHLGVGSRAAAVADLLAGGSDETEAR